MVDDSNKPESSASLNENAANQNGSSTEESNSAESSISDSSAADVEMSQYVADRARVNEDKIRQDEQIVAEFGEYNYGWHDSDAAGEAAKKGIDESVVRAISADKHEPEWMLNLRLQGYRAFLQKPMPDWGVDLSGFDADDFKYYVRPVHDQAKTWDDLPEDIRKTYDRLGIPEAEKKRLVSGVAAQYESEVIYNSIREDLASQGVIFVDTDTAVQKYPELVKKYFATVIPVDDNKFAALNTAAWSGGSFVYVPKGVHVDIPLQAYFRINTPNMGQFERTLIIADEGSYVHYVEGCTAPIYSTDSLHAANVEIVVEKHARVRYTTVQNWSNNVYNLVTQRAYVREGGTMEWVDGNIGSKATMKYPACILAEPYAKAETMSLSFAGRGQYQDTGAKMIHLAPHTSSTIVAKSISRGGGRSAYRGLVKIVKGASGSSSSVVCDALLVDDFSRSDTYPHVDVREDNVSMAHEATVSKVSEDQLFYLMSRGLEEKEAMGMIVRGFVEPISRQLPMEYALELNRLVELQMEGSVG
ncbi:FeS assembly protein SufB [Gardnerella vaginalis 315-A]|uniref:Fe-S cluster assembly protein SufB n=1 Tax=Gardnerella vaginalis TaxID=2702 RepID=UPI00020D6C6E|nr:Fe-S cluster assembly protein SufB [Gardnerella vaginalis]EGL14577.1 FeS assembly protein SufB [Gardnerella vaginalis 315-A]